MTLETCEIYPGNWHTILYIPIYNTLFLVQVILEITRSYLSIPDPYTKHNLSISAEAVGVVSN